MELSKDELSSDVTFVVKNDKFYGHFPFLAMTVPFFVDMICKTATECNHQEVIIIFAEEEPEALENALMELYTAGKSMKMENLMGFTVKYGTANDNHKISVNDESVSPNIELKPFKEEFEHSPEESINPNTLDRVDLQTTFSDEDKTENNIGRLENSHRFSATEAENIQYKDRNEDLGVNARRRKLLNCDLCEKDYETAFGLILHRKKVHGVAMVNFGCKPECPFCGKVVKHLDKHIRALHSEKSGCSVCEVCNATVPDMKKHRGKCNECKFCGYVNKHKGRLMKHINNTHANLT